MPNPSKEFVVEGMSATGSLRYWTGNMVGDFPEYVADRARATKLPRSKAIGRARRFNNGALGYYWTAEPAQPA